jgi:hypothetical protein
MQTTLSPKLQPFIKGFLALSPQEQLQLMTVLFQTLLGLQNTPMPSPTPTLKAGSAKGLITIADDFDEPLADFKEYM